MSIDLGKLNNFIENLSSEIDLNRPDAIELIKALDFKYFVIRSGEGIQLTVSGQSFLLNFFNKFKCESVIVKAFNEQFPDCKIQIQYESLTLKSQKNGLLKNVLICRNKKELDGTKTFDNYISDESNQRAYYFCKSFITPDYKRLTYTTTSIYGGKGRGKTHIVKALVQELEKENYGMTIYYVKVNDFNKYFQEVAGRKPSASGDDYISLIDKMSNADLLVLDDFETFLSLTPYYIKALYHIIDNRVGMNLPTILTMKVEPENILIEYPIEAKKHKDFGFCFEAVKDQPSENTIVVKLKSDFISRLSFRNIEVLAPSPVLKKEYLSKYLLRESINLLDLSKEEQSILDLVIVHLPNDFRLFDSEAAKISDYIHDYGVENGLLCYYQDKTGVALKNNTALLRKTGLDNKIKKLCEAVDIKEELIFTKGVKCGKQDAFIKQSIIQILVMNGYSSKEIAEKCKVGSSYITKIKKEFNPFQSEKGFIDIYNKLSGVF